MRTTKYIEGEIIKIKSGQLLIVQRMVLTHTNSCKDNCYFGSKPGFTCYYKLQNELPTKLACADLIPDKCCFKLLKEGV